MRHAYYFLIVFLLVSCSGDQVSPKVDPNSQLNPESGPAQKRGGSNARTTCEICADYTLPSCTCGGTFTGTHTTLGSNYHYPSRTAIICPDATSITVYVDAEDVPNHFTITYLDKNGGTVTKWVSNWIGIMNYPGPWGQGPISNLPTYRYAPGVTTTAQTGTWPCPFALPGSSETFSYYNDTGTPANGVTWSILSNTPAGSATLVGNGQVNQTVNFSSTFSSVQLHAATSDPSPTGGFQNCETNLTVTAPAISNIVAVKIDVWTVTPTLQSGVQPNTDYWEVTVSCTRNTSHSQCTGVRCF